MATYDENSVVHQGNLKKMNEYYMKQVRMFVLKGNGEMKYYKNETLHRGSIMLDKMSRVIKTSKTSFEIVTPNRTWYLYEVDTNTIDAWINALDSVISRL